MLSNISPWHFSMWWELAAPISSPIIYYIVEIFSNFLIFTAALPSKSNIYLCVYVSMNVCACMCVVFCVIKKAYGVIVKESYATNVIWVIFNFNWTIGNILDQISSQIVVYPK